MALNRADTDLGDGVLTVRCSKLGKSRLVPLHPTTTAALGGYAAQRDQLCHDAAALWGNSLAGSRP